MHHVDGAVGRPLLDGELRWGGGQSREIIFMPQRQPNSLDFGSRARAQISDGPMFDFAVVAKRLAQQIARVGFVTLANMGNVDVHCGYIYIYYYIFVKYNN
jgi:hypothetical protein